MKAVSGWVVEAKRLNVGAICISPDGVIGHRSHRLASSLASQAAAQCCTTSANLCSQACRRHGRA